MQHLLRGMVQRTSVHGLFGALASRKLPFFLGHDYRSVGRTHQATTRSLPGECLAKEKH
jgi:hypothetical protein